MVYKGVDFRIPQTKTNLEETLKSLGILGQLLNGYGALVNFEHPSGINAHRLVDNGVVFDGQVKPLAYNFHSPVYVSRRA